jgi:hypothetical protein
MKSFLSLLLAFLVLWGPVNAQIQNAGQVGVVVPAFDGEYGQSVAFTLRTLIRRSLSGQDPVTGDTGYGRGIAYYLPAPMGEPSHQGARALAERNGMQAVLWGQSTRLRDGIAYTSFLSIAHEYEDFRVVRPEHWSVTAEDVRLTLGPPRSFATFPPSVFSNEELDNLGHPSAFEHCPVGGGDCEVFEEYEIFRAIRVLRDGIIVDRDGTQYFVALPISGQIVSTPADYAGMFISYARGNFNDTLRRIEALISDDLPIDLRVDALLYRSSALARMERYDEARAAVEEAFALTPAAARTLRVAMMIEIAESGRWTPSAEELWMVFDQNYLPQVQFDLDVLSLRNAGK